jgi:hypothetical protein
MIVDKWKKLKDDIDDIEILLDLAREESDEQTVEDVEKIGRASCRERV